LLVADQQHKAKINFGVTVMARNEAICFSNLKNVIIKKADCFAKRRKACKDERPIAEI